jgi:hypothetical protein
MAVFGEVTGGTYREGRPPIAGPAGATLDAIYTGVTFLPSSTLFRASFFREGLRWRQECFPMEDMPIFCEVAARSAVAYVADVLSNYRVHSGSATCSPGAIGRNFPRMISTFRLVYEEHRLHITRRSYHWRMWWIYHFAADNCICAGQGALGLLLRALRHRPTAVVSWKVLAQSTARRLVRPHRWRGGRWRCRQSFLPVKDGRRP